MATYDELYDRRSSDALRNRCAIAVVKAAHTKITGTPTADEQKWASDVFRSPDQWGERALMGVLAANSAVAIAAIDGATDAQVQAAVDGIVDALIIAFAGGV